MAGSIDLNQTRVFIRELMELYVMWFQSFSQSAGRQLRQVVGGVESQQPERLTSSRPKKKKHPTNSRSSPRLPVGQFDHGSPKYHRSLFPFTKGLQPKHLKVSVYILFCMESESEMKPAVAAVAVPSIHVNSGRRRPEL